MSNMIPDQYKKYYPAAGTIAVLLLIYLTFFSVRETDFVLVTQFGRPVRTITSAGLHMKWFFQNVAVAFFCIPDGTLPMASSGDDY